MTIQNLGSRFVEISQKNSTRTAMIIGQETFTFEYLNHKSSQYAEYFRSLTIGRHDVVGISGEKSVWAYLSILACLKVGAVYTVIDPESPPERLYSILTTCKPKLIISTQSLEQTLKSPLIRSPFQTLSGHALHRRTDNSAEILPENIESVTGSDPAYIMFTSGSTGVPKGAVMTHKNVLDLSSWIAKEFEITPNDIFTNVNPLYFDNSVFDIYGSLFNGASLACFDKEILTTPIKLVEAIDNVGCTVWFSVPSLLIYLLTLRALSPKNFIKMKKIIFGGEGYPKAKLKNLFSLFGERIDLFNVYGPTECTCICSCYKITKSDFENENGFPPIGKLIENFSYVIVDEGLKPMATGQIGELILIGPNVGQGYYGDPKRTSAVFIKNPLDAKSEEKAYRTGDLFSYDVSSQKLLIHGRKDNQIKHLGYRIELEEIETAICKLPSVKQAVAFQVCDRDVTKIAVVISSDSLFQSDEQKIKEQLKDYLPHYMIPSLLLVRAELKKNPNGKVSRKEIVAEYQKLLGAI